MNRAFHLKLIFILLSVIFVSAEKIQAQLDPTFGTNGVTQTNIAGWDSALANFVLPDGKILVVTESLSPMSVRSYYFVRYNENGTLDTAYENGGKVLLPIPDMIDTDRIVHAARQPDGKIILVGNDSDNGIILRLNENGTLDTTFAVIGIHRPNINTSGDDGMTFALVMPDGKILVAGYTVGQSSIQRLYLLRYTANGAPDLAFGTEGYKVYNQFAVNNTGARFLFLQSTGKIVAIVTPHEAPNIPNGHAVRFNADGSLDSSYVITFSATTFRTALMQPDDKLLLAETVQKTDSLERIHIDASITRYNSNATKDTSFGGPAGILTYDVTSFLDNSPTAMQLMPDGQILVADTNDVKPNRSKFRGYMLSLTRLSPSGVINGKFLVTNSQAFEHYNSKITVLPSGKILALQIVYTSATTDYDILLARLTAVPLETYKLKGVPFDFHPTGFDGKSDAGVYRPSDRNWYLNNIYPGFFFGLSGDIPVASDYIQDFAAELAVFRPSNGKWYIARSYDNPAQGFLEVQWGETGDIPAPADYDGDGKSDLAVFRPSNGTWYIRNSDDNSATIRQWGVNGDKPAIGDFDGDSKYDIAVFRPSDGNWYIQRSSDGGYTILHFGLNGDVPVQEDYDGDGKTDIAVRRPSDGVWYRLNSSDGSFYALQWGLSTDVAVPADYDGDLKTDIAIWRPSEGRWHVYQSSNNSINYIYWGISTDIPVEGKF